MNGISYLLDTNIILGVLKGYAAAIERAQNIDLSACAYSSITRMELLGFIGITDTEEQAINRLLMRMTLLSLSIEIEQETIRLRRQYRLKLPDAIIAATAEVNGLELLTLDKKLQAKL